MTPKPSSEEAESLPPIDLDAIETAAKACTPLDFDTVTAGKSEGGWVECPHCSGEGSVELEADYCNFDGKALGVQFYGIGREHGAAEKFLRTASPKVVLELVSTIRALQAIASKAPQADGWQPIATAPKYTPIRLYAQGGGFADEEFNPSGSVEGHWSDDTHWCGAFWNEAHDCWVRRDGIVPTHWMPLPHPPKEKT